MQVGAIVIFSLCFAGCYAFYLPVVQQPGAKWALTAIYTVVMLIVTSLNIVTRSATTAQPACCLHVVEQGPLPPSLAALLILRHLPNTHFSFPVGLTLQIRGCTAAQMESTTASSAL